MNTDALVNRLLEARAMYYETDSPLMSDEDFDVLEEELRSHHPHHEYFVRVGFLDMEANPGGKIRHHVPMLSMRKAKDLQNVEKWLRRLPPPALSSLAVQPKIDGLSATLAYNEGHLSYVATRGDGRFGQNISHIASYIEDIPQTIAFTKDSVEIRGELHLPKNTDYDTGNRPLRNNCVGLINRKGHREHLRHIRFLAYHIVWPPSDHITTGVSVAPLSATRADPRFNSEFGKIDILAESGFYTFDTWLLTPDERSEDTSSHIEEPFQRAEESDGVIKNLIDQLNRIYQDYIGGLRTQWNYETDGLVLTVDDNSLHEVIDESWVVDHHHHYSLAFKPPSEVMQTTLRGIIWQVSRQGNLTPVAQFDPVCLGGATLERASLHNAENVQRLRLSTGDSILVERANDVIPHISHNPDGINRPDYFRDPVLWPVFCPSCDTQLREAGVNIVCPNPECRDRVLQSILYWVKQTGMEHIALGTLTVLYDAGKLRTIQNLYSLSKEDLIDLEGFGEKKITNFLEQTVRRKSMSPIEFIGRLGIPMVQGKSLNRLGIASIDDFMDFDDESYAVGKRIVEWKRVPENLAMVQELLGIVELVERSDKMERKGVICLTGKAPISRPALIAAIEGKGWTVAGAVTRNTVKLVCDDLRGTSSKLKKSREAGIEIVTYQEFLARENISV